MRAPWKAKPARRTSFSALAKISERTKRVSRVGLQLGSGPVQTSSTELLSLLRSTRAAEVAASAARFDRPPQARTKLSRSPVRPRELSRAALTVSSWALCERAFAIAARSLVESLVRSVTGPRAPCTVSRLCGVGRGLIVAVG